MSLPSCLIDSVFDAASLAARSAASMRSAMRSSFDASSCSFDVASVYVVFAEKDLRRAVVVARSAASISRSMRPFSCWSAATTWRSFASSSAAT